MSPSVIEMQNEISMCVCVFVTTEQGLFLFYRLGWQNRSKKGLAVSVLCNSQRMDQGQLDCHISNSWCFTKTKGTSNK